VLEDSSSKASSGALLVKRCYIGTKQPEVDITVGERARYDKAHHFAGYGHERSGKDYRQCT
jgi:hypothetical protein